MLTELNIFFRSKIKSARVGFGAVGFDCLRYRDACVCIVWVITSIPDDNPIAYWLGERKSEAISFVADMAWVAAILRIAVPIPMGRMLLVLVRSLWNDTLSFALMYCLISLGIDPLYRSWRRSPRRLIFGYLSSVCDGDFARTRKTSFSRSVESAKGPDDLSLLRRRRVERRRVSSSRRALTRSLLEEKECWCRVGLGRAIGRGGRRVECFNVRKKFVVVGYRR